MANLLYYSTFLLTVGLVVIAGFAARSAISKGGERKSCVRRFTASMAQLDHGSMAVIGRAAYETYVLFNFIFLEENSELSGISAPSLAPEWTHESNEIEPPTGSFY